MPYHQQLQQNINQIAQLCQHLSQSEQLNVSKLEQMVQAERLASQQLQQCVQLCNQAVQQMQQMATQFTPAQFGSSIGTPSNLGSYGNWSNIPINTNAAFSGAQRNFGSFQSANIATGTSAFNTNKDLGQ